MPVTAAARVTRPRWRRSRLAWVLWAVAVVGLAAWPWFDRLLGEAGRSDLVLATPDVPAAVVGILSAVTVGAVLASRRPAHPVGWLLLTLGLSLVASGVATQYVSYGLLARPGAVPQGDRSAGCSGRRLSAREGEPVGESLGRLVARIAGSGVA